MEAEGVEFCAGVDVGRDLTAEELRGRFDAVALSAAVRPSPATWTCRGRAGDGVWFAGGFSERGHPGPAGRAPGSGRLPLRPGQERGHRGRRRHGATTAWAPASARAARSGRPAGDDAPRPPTAAPRGTPGPSGPGYARPTTARRRPSPLFGHDPRLYETTVSRLSPGRGRGSSPAWRTVRPGGGGAAGPARRRR